MDSRETFWFEVRELARRRSVRLDADAIVQLKLHEPGMATEQGAAEAARVAFEAVFGSAT